MWVSVFRSRRMSKTLSSSEPALLLIGRSGNGMKLLANSIEKGYKSEKLQNVKQTNPGLNSDHLASPTTTTDPGSNIAGKDPGSDVVINDLGSATATTDPFSNTPHYIPVILKGVNCIPISINDNDFDNKAIILDKLDNALYYGSSGFSAVLIVLKYGVRFTKQEKDAISLIKYLLGEDCIRDYGIVVFTYGDNFDLDYEDGDTHTKFSTWCREQRGDVQALFREVDDRCVVFNNKTKDDSKIKHQLDILFDKIKQIKKTVLYTKEKYWQHLLKFSERYLNEKLKLVKDKLMFQERNKELCIILPSVAKAFEEKSNTILIPADIRKRFNKIQDEFKKLQEKWSS